ncbi:3-methylitaconate isomerase [Variovorax sp. PBS-H4]|uniref:2-methylaconitate cis-trans isomerase PrpF family protein n=1 Tax=Variovorax sp. PBS-H4 TaxID=434008 RepID=UPI0013194D9E|nr:PrpF domain-containing protein [Variovorax sp. PBS-H4]VTU26145.1 3-methylitaconate isomerase [Variovorax sp. PBS-H4]
MPTDTVMEQEEVRCVLMRGGTSKALFFHEADLPPAGAARDRLLKRAMGSPDVLQIDGLGGSRLVTSKVAIIRRSERADADVDYTFAQIDVERDIVGYDANCGNISSAVAPFAIDEGLVEATEPLTTVRIHNTNTGTLLVSKVPVKNGRARLLGDCAIAGVPGTGAEILMDYGGTIGAKTGKLLPTGQVTDFVTLEDGRRIEVSVVDAATPCVFIAAGSLGLTGSELPPAISADRVLIETIGELQCKAGERIGLYAHWDDVHLPGLPLAVIVAPPADYVDVNKATVKASDCDLRARLVFLGKCHDSMAGTGSICTAAASRVPGTLVSQAVGASTTSDTLRIGHPLGVMAVKVVAQPDAEPARTAFSALGLTRTARRLMAGTVYVPVA